MYVNRYVSWKENQTSRSDRESLTSVYDIKDKRQPCKQIPHSIVDAFQYQLTSLHSFSIKQDVVIRYHLPSPCCYLRIDLETCLENTRSNFESMSRKPIKPKYTLRNIRVLTNEVIK